MRMPKRTSGAPKGNQNAIGNNGGRPKEPGYVRHKRLRFYSEAEEAKIAELTPREVVEILIKHLEEVK